MLTVQEAMPPMALGELPEADEVLTPVELRTWLKVEEEWVEKNTQARLIPGQFKAGKYWRYRKAEILRNIILHGQALLDRKKAA